MLDQEILSRPSLLTQQLMGDFLGRDNITTLELELLGPLITLLVGLLSNESR